MPAFRKPDHPASGVTGDVRHLHRHGVRVASTPRGSGADAHADRRGMCADDGDRRRCAMQRGASDLPRTWARRAPSAWASASAAPASTSRPGHGQHGASHGRFPTRLCCADCGPAENLRVARTLRHVAPASIRIRIQSDDGHAHRGRRADCGMAGASGRSDGDAIVTAPRAGAREPREAPERLPGHRARPIAGWASRPAPLRQPRGSFGRRPARRRGATNLRGGAFSGLHAQRVAGAARSRAV